MQTAQAGSMRDLDLRLMLGSLGLLSLAIAYALGALRDGLGHCLQTVAEAPAHCPFCYAGAALLIAAAAPWPKRAGARR